MLVSCSKELCRSEKLKEGVKRGQNEPKGGFYRPLHGLGCPAHPKGPPVSVDWLTRSNFQKKKPFPLPRLRDKSIKCFRSNCSRSILLGKIWSQSVSSLHAQFGGDKIRNHILYLTPLIAIKMPDKEGVVIDTVFSICVPDLKKSKNISFSPWGRKNIQNDVA